LLVRSWWKKWLHSRTLARVCFSGSGILAVAAIVTFAKAMLG
jgi:hypothetical protein